MTIVVCYLSLRFVYFSSELIINYRKLCLWPWAHVELPIIITNVSSWAIYKSSSVYLFRFIVAALPWIIQKKWVKAITKLTVMMMMGCAMWNHVDNEAQLLLTRVRKCFLVEKPPPQRLHIHPDGSCRRAPRYTPTSHSGLIIFHGRLPHTAFFFSKYFTLFFLVSLRSRSRFALITTQQLVVLSLSINMKKI